MFGRRAGQLVNNVHKLFRSIRTMYVSLILLGIKVTDVSQISALVDAFAR